jgi:MFS family permease
MFGKERVLVIVLCVFALGSVIAAFSHSIELLVAGRAVQGAGGAVFSLAFGTSATSSRASGWPPASR